MQAYIGLTRKILAEYIQITDALNEFEIDLDDIPDGLLSEREEQVICLVQHVQQNPQIDLWKNMHNII